MLMLDRGSMDRGGLLGEDAKLSGADIAEVK